MRLLSRPGLQLIVLLLAVLAHAGLGVLASCPPAGPDRSATVASAAVAQPLAGSTGVPDRCLSDAPCQHTPTADHGTEAAARSHDVPRPVAPAVVVSSLPPSDPQPPSAPIARAVPSAAAVALVAVLCVDRN